MPTPADNPPCLRDMIRSWLIDNDYDGLAWRHGEDTCGCRVGDLMPCGDLDGPSYSGCVAHRYGREPVEKTTGKFLECPSCRKTTPHVGLVPVDEPRTRWWSCARCHGFTESEQITAAPASKRKRRGPRDR